MTYQEYFDETVTLLRPMFPAETIIRGEQITKNNDTSLEALIISEPGTNIFPTIYLNDFFERANKGESAKDLAKEIYTEYIRYKPECSFDGEYLNDFSKVKDNLVYRLVSREKNSKLLTLMPHVPYLDMELIFSVSIDCHSDVWAGARVMNSHMENWGTTPEELFALAKENTPRLLPPDLKSLPDFLNEIAGDVIIPEDTEDCLHVLTNTRRTNGAACMLYPDILRDFAKRTESDIYIIPSSIHEVMLLAARSGDDKEDLTRLIHEVNDTQVAPGEILSDHVYFYDRNKDEIEW